MILNREKCKCWYCGLGKRSGKLVFSFKLDTYVHINCIKTALERNAQDEDAVTLAKEFKIIKEEEINAIKHGRRVYNDQW